MRDKERSLYPEPGLYRRVQLANSAKPNQKQILRFAQNDMSS